MSFWALDVLRKLLNDAIRSRIRGNVVKIRAFTACLNTRTRATHNWQTRLQVFAQALAKAHKPSPSIHYPVLQLGFETAPRKPAPR